MNTYLLLIALFLVVLSCAYFIVANREQPPDLRIKSEQRANIPEMLVEAKHSPNRKRAIELWELAVQKESKGDYEGALADLDESIRLDSDNSAPYHNSRAIILSRMEKFEQAVEAANQAIEQSPNFVTPYVTRSIIHRRMGNPQAAIYDASKAILIATSVDKSNAMKIKVANSSKSDLDFAYISRGNARTQLRDYEGAIDDFTQGINLNPVAGQGYYGRGFAKKAVGDVQGAISDFEKAAEIYRQRGYSVEYQDAVQQISLLREK